jgi:hypothetical protein
MFIEHKQNEARHGKKYDGNTYTVIWPEGSGKNQQIQNRDSKFSHHKICNRNTKMPTINNNIMLDTAYLFIYLFGKPNNTQKKSRFNAYIIRHIQASER